MSRLDKPSDIFDHNRTGLKLFHKVEHSREEISLIFPAKLEPRR